jgi:glycosyltransferase involved in cell wall biosynthesis
MSRPKVLISAYACEPGKGSEPGIGWNWIEQAAAVAELWVITRANNKKVIEEACDSNLETVHWVFYDLPSWLCWWKRGPRGVALYYPLWQLGAFFVARRLHTSIGFDRVHHLTFGCYWLPTFLNRLPVPFVWGPVGGGESTPAGFYRVYSLRGRLRERARDVARRCAEALPTLKATARQSSIALATTTASADRLRSIGSASVLVFSHTALPETDFEQLRQCSMRDGAPFRLVSIGRFCHWKGFHLGLTAFGAIHDRIPDAEYWLIGDGPERPLLEALAIRNDLSDNVRFFGNLPRGEAWSRLAQCDVLVHPSFHDSGGYVCVEAMAAGRPVICLDTGGPALLVTPETGVKVALSTPEQTLEDLSRAILSLALDHRLRLQLGESARRRVQQSLRWRHKRTMLASLYGSDLIREGNPGDASAAWARW